VRGSRHLKQSAVSPLCRGTIAVDGSPCDLEICWRNSSEKQDWPWKAETSQCEVDPEPGKLVTTIPHTPAKKFTVKGIVDEIRAAAKFKD